MKHYLIVSIIIFASFWVGWIGGWLALVESSAAAAFTIFVATMPRRMD